MIRVMRKRRGRLRLDRLGRPFASLALLGAGLVLSGAFVGLAVRQSAVDQEAQAAREQIEQELARRAELEAAVAERQTEQYVVDRATDLGYVRPGEGMVAVERAAPTVAGVLGGGPDGGRLARWLALFFGPR